MQRHERAGEPRALGGLSSSGRVGRWQGMKLQNMFGPNREG